MNNLTLIIPAKNEKESLPYVLKDLANKKINIHVILEKSDHLTIESISKFDCKIIFQNGRGYGDALIEGINSVVSKYFCIFNADSFLFFDYHDAARNMDGWRQRIFIDGCFLGHHSRSCCRFGRG